MHTCMPSPPRTVAMQQQENEGQSQLRAANLAKARCIKIAKRNQHALESTQLDCKPLSQAQTGRCATVTTSRSSK